MVGGIKGGSGKSTIATNLTVLFTDHGRDVLLVDADDQETSADFTSWRNGRTEGGAGYTAIQLSGNAVRTEILRLKDKYDDIIVDTGGRDTTSQRAALTVSDICLVPFLPRSFDVWTLERVSKLVEEMISTNPNLRTLAFINRADSVGTDNEEARELLQSSEVLNFVDTPLGNRKAFSNAASQGMAVTELRPKDKKAIAEIENLFKFVLNSK